MGNRFLAVFIAASAVVAATALPAAAQDQMLFGDMQVFVQDTVASGDPDLASFVGMGPAAQVAAAQAQLNLHERLTFENGQLVVADSAWWWQGANGGTLQNDLRQAYVSFTLLPALTLVVGKQRLPWGTGYAFTPGDRIDPPVNPQNTSEGFVGFTATLAPSSSFSLSASVRFDTAFPSMTQLPGLPSAATTDPATLFPFLDPFLPSTPSSPWLGLRYAVYADAFLGGLDLHVGTTWQWEKVLRPTAGFSLEVLGFIVDGTVAVELCNGSLYPGPGGTYAPAGFGKAFPLATVGLQRSVSLDDASFAATIEYLYDGTGYDAGQAARFYDDFFSAAPGGSVGGTAAALELGSGGAWFESGEVLPALGQHYAALSLDASMTSVFSAALALVVNLQDGSFAVQPEVRWTRLSGIDLFARATAAWGRDARTEFGIVPVPLTVCAGAIVHF